MASLKIRLLGTPQVEIDGGRFQVDTRKALALLAYLAVSEGPRSRDVLGALLWPEYGQARARAALRRTLSTLRKALGGGWLTTNRDTVFLEGPFWSDIGRFNEHVRSCGGHGHGEAEACERCIQPLSEAATLCRGDFMDGFSLRDSLEYEEWQSFQAGSFRRSLEGVLQRLVGACSAAGNYQTALDHARRWLGLDPLQEAAHQSIMQLYAQTGDRSAAVRQYRECLRTLEQELGVKPLDETTALYQAILAGEVAADVPRRSDLGTPRPSRPGRAAGELPLVGREVELETLTQAIEGTTGGQFIVLEGEAGIGKTRLLRDVLERAESHARTVLTAQCYEGEESIAFGPIIALLRAALATPAARERLEAVPDADLVEASRLLPDLAHFRPGLPPPPPLDPPSAQVRFFEGVVNALVTAAAGDVPGVLVAEDLHWADEASLDLLCYLARRLKGRLACLACTWRSENVPLNHRLRRLVAELEREGAATHLRLGRLSLEAVSRLLASASVPQPEPAALAARLLEETEGVPFFIVQYLEAVSEGAAGEESWNLPSSVADLLRARIAHLGQAERQIVTAAAVIGRSFAFDVLRQASGRSEEEGISAVETLVRQGFFQPLAQGDVRVDLDYDFSHEKLRSFVYEEASLPRRRLLHRRVAEALARAVGPGRRSGAAQVAHHYRAAGLEKDAVEFFRLAGDHARALHANVEALAHYQEALSAGHPAACELHEQVGELHMLNGAYAAALASYQTAAALAGPHLLPLIEHRIGGLYLRLGAWSLADQHLMAALDGLTGENCEGERARVIADRSLTAQRRGEREEAASLAEDALRIAERADDGQALAQARNILGILALGADDPDRAIGHLEESLALADRLEDEAARVAALNNLALALRAKSDLGRAEALTQTALDLCERLGDRHREAALHNNFADLLRAAGRQDEAMSHLKQAVVLFAEVGADQGDLEPEVWKLVEW